MKYEIQVREDLEKWLAKANISVFMDQLLADQKCAEAILQRGLEGLNAWSDADVITEISNLKLL